VLNTCIYIAWPKVSNIISKIWRQLKQCPLENDFFYITVTLPRLVSSSMGPDDQRWAFVLGTVLVCPGVFDRGRLSGCPIGVTVVMGD